MLKILGIGDSFAGILAVAFIVLKLLGVIQWSWLWVLSPLWICLLLNVLMIVAVYLYARFSRW